MWKLRLKEVGQQLAELKLEPWCVCDSRGRQSRHRMIIALLREALQIQPGRGQGSGREAP